MRDLSMEQNYCHITIIIYRLVSCLGLCDAFVSQSSVRGLSME